MISFHVYKTYVFVSIILGNDAYCYEHRRMTSGRGSVFSADFPWSSDVIIAPIGVGSQQQHVCCLISARNDLLAAAVRQQIQAQLQAGLPRLTSPSYLYEASPTPPPPLPRPSHHSNTENRSGCARYPTRKIFSTTKEGISYHYKAVINNYESQLRTCVDKFGFKKMCQDTYLDLPLDTHIIYLSSSNVQNFIK